MDLLNDRVRDVYLKYLAAALGSTLIMSIYSIVDTIIIGHYEGPNGTAAVATFMPLWTLLFAFGLLFGIGGSVLMTQARGAGDAREGNRHYTVALAGAVATSCVLLVLCNALPARLLSLCGASGEVLELALLYVRHIARAVPVFVVGQALIPFVRVDGFPGLTTLSATVGGVLNMVGDLLLVYGLDMGIEGAGLATALGQTVAFAMLLVHLARGGGNLGWDSSALFDGSLARLARIVATGAPPPSWLTSPLASRWSCSTTASRRFWARSRLPCGE